MRADRPLGASGEGAWSRARSVLARRLGRPRPCWPAPAGPPVADGPLGPRARPSTRPLRVLHVINQFSGRAGAEISLRDLLTATGGSGIEHGLLVLKASNNDFDGVPPGVRVFCPEADEGLLAEVRRTSRAVRAFEPDLIHASITEAGIVARIAATPSRTRVLVSLVNTTYSSAALVDRDVSAHKLRAVKAVDRWLSRSRRVSFHAITDAVRSSAVEDLRIDPGRVQVVPRGRSDSRMGRRSPQRGAEARRRLGIGEDVPLVVAVGREEPQKGHTYLVEALALLRRTVPDVQLVIAGRRGARSPAIDEAVDRLELGPVVHRIGVRKDVPDILSAGDAFAFPSLYEGLGGALIEAMALEVPVVAFDSPAVREVLDDGRVGSLVPTRDVAALAESLGSALRRPDPEVVAAARRRYEDRYELDAVASQMVDLWRSCVAGR